jgi:hypothetical protein
MKRGRPKVNPDRVREWQRRSRDRAIAREQDREDERRAEEIRRVMDANPKPRRARSKADRRPGARGFTQRVFCLYGRRCVRCKRAAVQAHHAVPRRTIEARGDDFAEEFAYDARNGVPLCVGCHWDHEYGARDEHRLPRACLPLGVIEWAVEQGFGWYIDRTYR